MAGFARALGLAPETYRRYERAETEPNIYLLKRIYEVTEVTSVTLDFIVAGVMPQRSEGEVTDVADAE